MIVISRQRGESIVLADDIIVTVIEVRDDEVRLGIEIPRAGTVHRRELYEAIVSTKDAQDTGPSFDLDVGGDQ
jgi:carbon storage regulator